MKMSNRHGGEVNVAFENTEGDLSDSLSNGVKPKTASFGAKPTSNGQATGKAELEKGTAVERGHDRPTWGNSIEFLLSCISMSVGLGNIWRFPFTAFENGGGAFLIPYIIVLLVIGKPMYYLEMTMGQFSSNGAVKMWDVIPILRGIGVGQILATTCVVTYYASLIAITLHYMVSSFSSELPWARCQPGWENCVDSTLTAADRENITSNVTRMSSSEYYFLNVVVKEKEDLTDGIGYPSWVLAIYLFIAWVVIFLIIVRGVRSSGKASYFLALFPYLVLFILLVRACTLEGSIDGIIYFFKPQWGELLNPKIWFEAAVQAFFSLSIGCGSIIMFSSYNQFTHDISRDCFIVTLMDTFTSILAGTTIFAILGNLAHNLGVKDIKDVVKKGTGLAFISYPDAIAKFDWMPQLFSVLFFFMLFVLGVGSAVALQSAINTVIWDQMNHVKYWKVAGSVSTAGFLIGLFYITPGGQWILDLVDHFGGTFLIFALVILEIGAIFWIYGIENLTIDLQFMIRKTVSFYWRFTWVLLTPLLMLVIFIYYLVLLENPKHGKGEYPFVILFCGWMIFAVGVFFVPAFAALRIYRSRKLGFLAALKKSFHPNKMWGPKSPKIKTEWLRFKDEIIKHRHQETYEQNHSMWRKVLNIFLGKYQKNFVSNYS
ncbi:sodium-dependent nutrient amino acid transporter 1-like isoform X2 [Culicoides brevitarsis]|uniref:sodium-dependent nutrient amino acid transporter 1-like isoform X2 n=1 Tax=Culicoides brevitarsis TaxID=469753 RepID=UPI00307C0AC2